MTRKWISLPARSACMPRRLWRGTRSLSVRRTYRVVCLRAGETKKATSAHSTHGPASASGFSIPFRLPTSTETKPGRTIPGPTRATPASGGRLAWTKSSGWSTSRLKCRQATTTAAIAPVTIYLVPASWHSATQPFPTKPPAFERHGVSIDDLIDFTPELRAEAVKLASLYKLGPIFTPPVASKWEGPRAMLMLPSTTGGANWQGGSYDPDTGIMYIFSNTGITDIGLVNNPQLSDMNFIRGTAPNPNAPPPSSTAGGGGGEGGGPALNIQGLPLVKPPYGRITAIDLNKGEMVWQIAHGETPDNIRNHPALKGLKIPRTGRQGRIGTLVTKTLLIAGEGGFFTTPSGQRGAMLRAYDKANGQEVGSVYMPAPQTGSPMTYMLNGKQHIIVSIGGGGYSGELLALRL